MGVCSILRTLHLPAHRLASPHVRVDVRIQVVVPTLTPGATLLALHHVLSNLQNTIRARPPPDLSRALLIILGESLALLRLSDDVLECARYVVLDSEEDSSKAAVILFFLQGSERDCPSQCHM